MSEQPQEARSAAHTASPPKRATTYPTLPQLDSLEFLVATKMERPEQWQTFVALLRLAGYEPTPDGVRRIGS